MFSVESLTKVWNAFFHTPQSATTIGVFRILWGVLLLVNGLLLVKDVSLFFGPNGLLPINPSRRPLRLRLTLFELLPKTQISAYLVLAMHLLAAFSLTIGFYTRSSATLAFTTLLSLFHRNSAVFHGGDTVIRALTFLLIFSRADQAFSLDHHLEMLAKQGHPNDLS